MKILHSTKALWTGGIETMVCNLANKMSQTEDVSVCVFWQTNKEEANSRLKPDVCFFDLGFNGKGKPFKEIFDFYRAVKRGNYDIVNIHGFFYLYMLCIFLLHRKTKFVYTLHSDAYHEGTEWDNKLIAVKRFFFKKGWMHPICISTHAQKTFFELYGCECALIHNGIALEKADRISGRKIIDSFKKTNKTKVFLHPGRITEAKNQITLCEVFSKLIHDGFDVVLLIAGGQQDSSIFKLMSKYFTERIIYIGERRDILDLLSASDGMCLPSLFEGFGLVVVEALSQECIPICTPVGGIPDIVKHSENGLLSASPTAVDYYDAMVNFLSLTDDDVYKMKVRALESCSQFDISSTTQQYLRLYSTL